MIRNIFKHFMLTAFIASLTVNVYANTTDLQLMLDNLMKTQDVKNVYISGIPLTVQYNSDDISNIASGKMSHEPNAQNLPTDAIVQIGSMTKTFIGVLSVKLAHTTLPNTTMGYFGVNGLDATVGSILGNKPTSKNWNSNWNTVTLRQLLNMTSGIPDYVNDDQNAIIIRQYSQNPYYTFSLNDLLSVVASKDLLYLPGHGYNYSNINYLIMGEVISKVTDSSVRKQLEDQIINPLKLEHTYYVEDKPEDAIARAEQNLLLVSGYPEWVPDELNTPLFYNGVDIKQYSLSDAGASGGMISNTFDVNMFIQAIFSTNNNFLTVEERNELTDFIAMKNEGEYKAGDHISNLSATVNKGFGLGIVGSYIPTVGGGNDTIYFKPGGTFGFSSQWVYRKSQHSSTVFTLNAVSSSSLKCSIEMYLINQTINIDISDCDLISD